MKNLMLIIVFFLPKIVSAQVDCVLDANGNLDNDEPPGCAICGPNISSTTAFKTADNFTFDFPCGEIENSQWFALLPNFDSALEIGIIVNNCLNDKGIEVAVYDQDFNLVSECKVIDWIFTLEAENLNWPKTHYLMVDGVDGDICEFEILAPTNTWTYFQPSVSFFKIDQPEPYCIRTEVCFSIDPIESALGYIWEAPATISKGGAIQDTFMCVQFDAPFLDREVIVTPFGPCGTKISRSKSIDVERIIRQNIDTTRCQGECIQVRDSCYSSEGSFRISIFHPNFGCDTIITLNIENREVFSSPFLECKDTLGQLFLNWNRPSGAVEFEIFINRDLVSTVSDNFIWLDNLPSGVPIDLKVQPIGNCSYLPAETSCSINTSNTTDDFLNERVLVYPNPTSSKLTIETDLQIEEILIFDTTGRLLQKENTTAFELKNRKAGIYFLKIKTENGIALKRIILK